MTTIENLKQLETELTTLAKAYSETMTAVRLYEEQEHITKVLRFLQEKEEWFKNLYYENILKNNLKCLSDREFKDLRDGWLNTKDMIELCDKYNIDYNIIDFSK